MTAAELVRPHIFSVMAGFLAAEREGTRYEIGLLAKHGILESVMAVGDRETDWAHVDHFLGEAAAEEWQ